MRDRSPGRTRCLTRLPRPEHHSHPTRSRKARGSVVRCHAMAQAGLSGILASFWRARRPPASDAGPGSRQNGFERRCVSPACPTTLRAYTISPGARCRQVGCQAACTAQIANRGDPLACSEDAGRRRGRGSSSDDRRRAARAPPPRRSVHSRPERDAQLAAETVDCCQPVVSTTMRRRRAVMCYCAALAVLPASSTRPAGGAPTRTVLMISGLIAAFAAARSPRHRSGRSRRRSRRGR